MGVLLGKSLHFYYIMAVLIGKYCSPTIMVILLTLILLWLYFYWKTKKQLHEGFSLHESGFSQDSPYVISSDVYDDFYVQIYDSLMLSQQRASQFWDAFTQGVQPFQGARFLDVGSGTGAMVAKVSDSGFECIGVDSSLTMIQSSLAAYPTNSSSHSFLHTSVDDPMLFDRDSFFGVFCLGMTLYEFSDSEKLQFFKNAYFWIRPGGYLLLHLVDFQHFSTLLPIFSSRGEKKEHKHGKISDYTFDLDGFSYRKKMQMNMDRDHGHNAAGTCEGSAMCGGGGGCNGSCKSESEEKCTCSVSEYFIDHASSFVRQNDSVLHFASRSSILKMASHAGFVPVGLWNLQSSVYNDPHQFLYLLERTL